MEKLKIEIDEKIYNKLFTYINCINTEIGGFVLGKTCNKVLKIIDIFLPPQKVSFSTYEMQLEKLNARDTKFLSKKSQFIIGTWHSHVNMAAHQSIVDIEDIDNQIKKGKKIWLSLVANKRREIDIQIRIVTDYVDVDLTNSDIDIMVLKKEDLKLKEKIKKEIAKKVTEEKEDWKKKWNEELNPSSDKYWFVEEDIVEDEDLNNYQNKKLEQKQIRREEKKAKKELTKQGIKRFALTLNYSSYQKTKNGIILFGKDGKKKEYSYTTIKRSLQQWDEEDGDGE